MHPIGVYLRMIDRITRRFRKEILPLLKSIDRTDSKSTDKAVPQIWKLIQAARLDAVQVGNQMLIDGAAQHGAQAYLPPPDAYSQRAVRKLMRDYQNRSDETLLRAMDRHITSAARRQVQKAVLDPEIENYISDAEKENLESETVTLEGFEALDDLERRADEEIAAAAQDSEDGDEGAYTPAPRVRPVGWARVLTGEFNCGFCIMLASRGAVYSSKLAAKYRGGRRQVKTGKQGQKFEAAKTRARREAYREVSQRKFHDGCDCAVVPVWEPDNWVGQKEAEKLREFYDKVRRETDKDAKKNPEKYKGKSEAVILEEYLEEMRAKGGRLDITDKRAEAKQYDTSTPLARRHKKAVEKALAAADKERAAAQRKEKA